MDISKKDKLLEVEINKLEPALINELAVVDARFRSANELLGNHLAPSHFFKHLEEVTLQSIRLTDFSYTATPGTNPTISMSGTANSYSSVALQSDVLSRDEFISSVLFSGLDVSESGQIIFDINAEVNKRLTSYKP